MSVKQEEKMKRLFVVMIAAIAAALLAGCFFPDDVPDKEQGNSSAYGEKDVYGLNETAVFKTLKFTATDVKETKGDGILDAAPGKIYVGVKFTVENISSKEEAISSLMLFDCYADGAKCAYSIGANSSFGDGGLDGDIAAGKKLVGWYAVEISEEWKELELTVKSSWLSKSTAKFRITPEMVSERENVDSGTVDGIHGLNDTVSVKGLDFTASEFRESKGGKYSEAAEGKIFVGVKFTIENKSDSEKSISSILLFDGYADGVKCVYAYGAGDEFDGQLDGNLAPGRRMIGWYVVEVPADWQEIDLVVRSEWLSKNTVTFRITR